jgi:glycosyltransferase involved in cell wall biosynthesis
MGEVCPSALGGTIRLSVVVPTICRPAELDACLSGIAMQTWLPEEVVVVLPHGNSHCADIVSKFQDRIRIRPARGSENGIVRAVNIGLLEAKGDVVCLIDDDATAPAHWLERISHWFEDPLVGAVGGPHVQPGHTLQDLPGGRRWDRLTWFGYAAGPRTHLRMPGPQRAHFLAEGAIAFRREAIGRIDERLIGRDERFGDDITLPLLRRGFRVIADPQLFVWHSHARFEFVPDRLPAAGHVYAVAHNQTYLWLKHLPAWRRPPVLLWGLLVGDHAVKGFVMFLGWMAKNANRPDRIRGILELILPTYRGRRDGVMTYLRRGRPCGE